MKKNIYTATKITIYVCVAFVMYCVLNSYRIIGNESPRKGKVVMTVNVDGQSIDHLMGGPTIVYIYGTFLIEYTISIHFSGIDSATGNVIQYRPEDPRYRELTGYSVTDLATETVTQFNKNLDSPELMASFPLSQKKIGYLLVAQKEVDFLKDAVARFHYVKDTVIGHVAYKILEDTVSRTIPGQGIIQKSIAYLNPAVKNFPVKLSTFLDEKFGGWVNKITILCIEPTTNRTQVVTKELIFDENLTAREIETIERLVGVTKEHLASKK